MARRYALLVMTADETYAGARLAVLDRTVDGSDVATTEESTRAAFAAATGPEIPPPVMLRSRRTLTLRRP